MNITDDYNVLNNCTNNEKEDKNIIIKYLFLSVSSSLLLLCFISLIIGTLRKPLFSQQLINGQVAIPSASS